MSSKELQDRYGKNNSAAAINAAIRAEIPGGDELLEVLETAHKAAGRKDDPSASSVGRILTGLRAVKRAMEAEVRRRYGMPPAE